jgi:branched-chain amino acid transport system permease protein
MPDINWSQQLLNGLFAGSAYALFAVGYTLIFGVLDILNLAHQAIYMLGAFCALVLVTGNVAGLGPLPGGMQLPFWLATLLAMLVAGLLGILLDRLAFAPLRKRPDTHFSGMISSIAVALIFEALATWLFLPQRSQFPAGTIRPGAVTLGQGALSYSRVLVIVAALVLVVLLTVLLRFTSSARRSARSRRTPRPRAYSGLMPRRSTRSVFFSRQPSAARPGSSTALPSAASTRRWAAPSS